MTLADKVGFMNPWKYVIDDMQYIAGNKEQAFGRVLETWFETHLDQEYCFRVFCDNLENLFMSADCIIEGSHVGHAIKIPVANTSHGTRLQSGDKVNATDKTLCDFYMNELTETLLEKF
jgi:hypothetical protein